MSITDGHVDLLSRLMDASLKRQQVIGANIANVNTPGYQRTEVRFEDELSQVLKQTEKLDVDKINQIKIEVGRTPGLTMRQDGNNVNIDSEIGALNKNSLLFETYTQLMATQVAMMNSAINGRS